VQVSQVTVLGFGDMWWWDDAVILFSRVMKSHKRYIKLFMCSVRQQWMVHEDAALATRLQDSECELYTLTVNVCCSIAVISCSCPPGH